MQQILSYISAHWTEWAIWLLGLGLGYLVKKVTEYTEGIIPASIYNNVSNRASRARKFLMAALPSL